MKKHKEQSTQTRTWKSTRTRSQYLPSTKSYFADRGLKQQIVEMLTNITHKNNINCMYEKTKN